MSNQPDLEAYKKQYTELLEMYEALYTAFTQEQKEVENLASQVKELKGNALIELSSGLYICSGCNYDLTIYSHPKIGKFLYCPNCHAIHNYPGGE